LPGVRSAAVTDTLPLAGDDNRSGIQIPGRPARPGERLRLHPRLVTKEYLQTMRMRLLEGRAFTAADEAGAKQVAILSETAVRQFWPEGRAVGRYFKFSADKAPLIEVIGIAAAVHNDAPEKEATADAYMPFRENPFGGTPRAATLVLRTEQDEAALAGAVRNVVGELDRSLPLSKMRRMEAYVEDSVAPNRFNLILLGLFAGVAIVLAVAGVYGVMAYGVNQRTAEIGLRVALGARPWDVVRQVMGRGLALAIGGVLVGFAAALAGTRLMSHMLFGVDPRDPGVFIAASLILVAAGALASYIPARRASRVDPLVALRNE
jgi:putative ABC transport system permease protein